MNLFKISSVKLSDESKSIAVKDLQVPASIQAFMTESLKPLIWPALKNFKAGMRVSMSMRHSLDKSVPEISSSWMMLEWDLLREIQLLWQNLRFVPFNGHDMFRLQASAVHQQTLQSLWTLEKRFEGWARDFVAKVHGQTFKLNAVGAESVDMRVIDEIDSVQIDDAEVRCRCF